MARTSLDGRSVNGHGSAAGGPAGPASSGPAPAGTPPVPAAPIGGAEALAAARDALRVALPEPGSRYDQDDEWCVVQRPDGAWTEFRFHDYDRIFDVPGLYEKIFYDVLGCDSPRFMVGLLREALDVTGVPAEALRVLDLGAGNGIMAEELAAIGVGHAVGVDILSEAATAAERDRPGLYADYEVADLTALPAEQHAALAAHELNALTVVAALGFGDIPPEAFGTAYDLVADGGWVVLTIKDAFLTEGDRSGFAAMIRGGLDSGALEVVRRERFQHRMATDSSPLVYEGIVARKRGPLGR